MRVERPPTAKKLDVASCGDCQAHETLPQGNPPHNQPQKIPRRSKRDTPCSPSCSFCLARSEPPTMPMLTLPRRSRRSASTSGVTTWRALRCVSVDQRENGKGGNVGGAQTSTCRLAPYSSAAAPGRGGAPCARPSACRPRQTGRCACRRQGVRRRGGSRGAQKRRQHRARPSPILAGGSFSRLLVPW